MEYLQKLDETEKRFDELSRQMADPEVISDQESYQKTAKQVSDLTDLVAKYRDWRKVHDELEGARAMLAEDDAEMRSMAEVDIAMLEPQIAVIEEELKLLMMPKDPLDDKNVVLEVHGGAGGDESTLFAAEMFRAYLRYAELQHWKVEITSQSDSSVGGIKEITALISGKKVYSRLRHEGGVHRVQRVPATETQGRIHTSTIRVAVMPEADEVDIKLEAKDVRVDTFCSSGPGGQSVNTTYSAVRLTHLPTGTIVSCQDEKSQIKNRAKAERVLRARLYDLEMEKQNALLGAERRSMVGSGDRSEKIRTYNFKENRVTDHRIGVTVYQLEQVMQGAFDQLIDPAITYFQTERMRRDNESQAAA